MSAPVANSVIATSESKAARPTAPRKPVRKRSRERYERLLDATESLLSAQDAGSVGLYDIAKQASVPPASVYHFFPTKEAAFVALAERFLVQLNAATHILPLDHRKIEHWSDIFIMVTDRLITFYNDHPVLLKLFFGSGLTPDIRRRDMDYINSLSESGYAWMNRYFVMPYIPDPEMKFAIIYAIYDGITCASYERHGRVTDEFRDGLIAAVLAYCRTFLPDVIPLRPPEIAQA